MNDKLKTRLEKFKKNKDGKVLVSNFGYLMLLKVAGYIFPLLTIPYLARVLGVEGFGLIAFASAVVAWLWTVTDWGFNYTATRDVAKSKDDLKKVSRIFSNVLWARAFLAIISLMLLLLAITFIPYFRSNKLLLLITFLSVPGNILFPEWFFQAMERMKFITLFNLISKALFTILVFIFIKTESDLILQPLFISLGYLVSGFFSMYIIIFKWEVKIFKPRFKEIFDAVSESTDVFINNLMPNLYNSLSVVILSFIGGSAATGIYDAGRKFILIALSFMDVFIRATFPFLSRKIEAHSIFSKFYITISISASILVFLLSPFVIRLFFTEDFYEATIVMQISSVSIFLVSLSKVYGTNYLIIQGYEKDLRNITVVCSVIGFIISLPLIYCYSYIGVALTLVVTQAILGFSTFFKARLIRSRHIKNVN